VDVPRVPTLALSLRSHEQFGEPVLDIALDHHAAGLDEIDVLAASARCSFSKTLDSLILADASYRELDPRLRETLVVGRPIADA
jgi:hypothetical protein